MAATPHAGSKKAGDSNDRLQPVRDWIDVLAKAGIAAIGVWFGFLASDFKDKMGATALLSERERAESDLRAGMMRDLVPRFIEQPPAQTPADLHRARVFLELLALNFHTHFEMKPLFLELDSRIAAELAKNPQESALSQLTADRDGLRSVARRVVDRQIEMLAASEPDTTIATESTQASAQSVPRSSSTVDIWYQFLPRPSGPIDYKVQYLDPRGTRNESEQTANDLTNPAVIVGDMGSQPVCVVSTDGRYALLLNLSAYDEKNGTVHVDARAASSTAGCSPSGSHPGRTDSFTLTPYDLPLTDNTRLEANPRQRYALNLYRVLPDDTGPEEHRALLDLRLVWFPEGYITERERPMNFTEVRKALDLK